ncbi:MAG: V-type ATP synthase subunit F, partial [bacterium]
MDTAKIAYIGDETTSLLFKSIGVNSFCFRRGEAKEKFENLVNSGEYAIIFISEDFYLELAEM